MAEKRPSLDEEVSAIPTYRVTAEGAKLLPKTSSWGVALDEIDGIVALPYTREVLRNADGSWIARVIEFTGCIAEGDTPLEALGFLEESIADWIHEARARGETLAQPLTVDGFSGKFMVRVAASLHRDISICAEREGVSLNNYVATQLARAIGGAFAGYRKE